MPKFVNVWETEYGDGRRVTFESPVQFATAQLAARETPPFPSTYLLQTKEIFSHSEQDWIKANALAEEARKILQTLARHLEDRGMTFKVNFEVDFTEGLSSSKTDSSLGDWSASGSAWSSSNC